MSGLDSLFHVLHRHAAALARPPSPSAVPAVTRLVNSPVIADPAPDPLPPPDVPANNDRLTIPAQPFARRQPAVAGGLRVVPLAAFAWAGATGQPRSRGDQVLIWRADDARGAATLRLPGGAVPLVAGGLHFLPAGTAFATAPASGVEGAVLLIPRDAPLAAPLPGAPVRGRVAAADAATMAVALAAIAAATGGPDDATAAACHLGLVALALGRVEPIDATPDVAAPRTPDSARALFERFVTLAENELGRGRTLGDLAATLGVSTGDLDRASGAARGVTALEVVYDLRLTRAIALLRQTRLSPQRIADSLGFTSLAHMARIISTATGRGPEAFRRGD